MTYEFLEFYNYNNMIVYILSTIGIRSIDYLERNGAESIRVHAARIGQPLLLLGPQKCFFLITGQQK
jgi:hypothetical protein